MNRTYFKVPNIQELVYRKKLLDNEVIKKEIRKYPEFEEFNNNIEEWYRQWTQDVPNKFYTYIVRKDDNVILGEASFAYDRSLNAYSLKVIIEPKYRNFGYGEEALRRIVELAFAKYNFQVLVCNVQSEDIAAHRILDKVGFIVKLLTPDFILLELTKERFENRFRKFKN